MFARRHVLSVVAAAAALTLGLGACGTGSTGSQSSATSTLTLAAGVEPLSLDPAQAREAQFGQYFQPLFDTLVRRLPDGKPSPMLAESWKYNAGNTELTLKLRKGVTFSDGKPFDAEAAKKNLDRFKTAKGPLAAQLAAVAETEAPDLQTLIIRLATPDPALLYNLGGPPGYMQSPGQFASPDIDTKPAGSGPYQLDRSQSTPGAQYTFVKTKGYWAPDLQKFDKIVIKPILDENARLNAVRSGQADGMIATAKSVTEAKKSGNVTVNTVPGDWQGLTLFDRDGTILKELKDVRVRQAISHAIDKQALLDAVVLGQGKVTDQIVSPTSTGYIPELDSAYPYDVEKAKSLLAEAGVKSLTLKMPTSADVDPAMSQAIKDQLAKAGVTVEWVDLPAEQYQPEQQSGKYAAAFTAFGQSVLPWANISPLVSPHGAWNPLKTSDPEIATMLKDVQNAPEDAIGAEYQKLNEEVVKEAWFVPFFRINQPYFTSDKVEVEMQAGQPVPAIYNFAPAS
ncbi:ABC transporter substrate-binding protein [Nonomuraea sp. NPDC059194]|uniref:ABC transporter substrate-binding protein n=1 Tax=Nonomuraea sp. NPDC059194 TaxID=3346764 RepID=UPI003683272F